VLKKRELLGWTEYMVYILKSDPNERKVKIMTTFETMLELLKSNLAEETRTPYLQATALLTDHGNVYVAVCRDFIGSDCGYDNMLTYMKTRGETRILKMVTMWKDGGIDLSPMNFRESIYEMNKENIETEVLVLGENRNGSEERLQPFVKKMINTLPIYTIQLLRGKYKDWTNAKKALDAMEKYIEQHGMSFVDDVLRTTAPEIWEDIYGR
jgi:cytidine deaminase